MNTFSLGRFGAIKELVELKPLTVGRLKETGEKTIK